MTRYDDLSPRALWFLQNFDELTLAEMCAANEAASQATAERVRHVADLIENGAPWTANRQDTARRVREAVQPQEPSTAPAAKPKHIGNGANAEDCGACSGTNPPYPFICPGEPS